MRFCVAYRNMNLRESNRCPNLHRRRRRSFLRRRSYYMSIG